MAYHLDRTKSSRGVTIKSIQKIPASILNRELKTIPKGYFSKNRNKFTLRRVRTARETYEMIEKNKFRLDSKLERKIIKRRRVVKRR